MVTQPPADSDAALSPGGIIRLMQNMNRLERQNCQFIIATHSPMLLCFPDAEELLDRYSGENVTAVDYSELSVEKAREYNQKAIDSERCTVRQGDVSALDLPSGQYDLATAFETIYFWPGLEKCFTQVHRILKPGGLFLICNESNGTDAVGQKFEKIIDGMKVYTGEQIESALKTAGFSDVKTERHPSKPWITVLAKK